MRLALPLRHCQLLFSPLEVDMTYVSCMHQHWSTQSFHSARGRAVWSQDTIPEGLSAAGAFLQKPSVSLSITRQLSTKSL